METGRTTDDANLEAFLIRKETVDEDLWNYILIQSKGTSTEKIKACMLILQNYRNVPREADDILKGLAAPTEHEDVRETIASELVKENIQIPGGLYFDLLIILINDPNPQIRKIVAPKYNLVTEPMLRFAEFWQKHQAILLSKIAHLAIQYQQLINESLNRLTTVYFNISKILQEPEFKDFEYNWLVFLPVDKLLLLYKMHKMGKDAEIKQLLIQLSKDKEYLRNFIEEMKASSIFKPREPLIQDAIEAYEMGKHSLCIPVLLAQIEGILWAYAEKQNIKFRGTITTKNGKKKIESVKLLLKNTMLKDQISEYFTQHFLNKIYTEDFRHGILHGRNITYNTEENSMKLLLLVRALLDQCD